MNSSNFRVSPDILRRLGEELITTLDQGVVELVKNSYDADALSCTVELLNTDEDGGAVVITDDGDGMSLDDILSGWLVLGHSRKIPRERTRLNRLPAGSKGLGRLGALRMGAEVLLVTRPRNEPKSEYSLFIRWSDFEQTSVIEDIGIPIHHQYSTGNPGTRIEIRGLRSRISETEVRRLARELILLSNPFEDQAGFTPELIAPEFKELERLVHRRYFDDCEFQLVAQLDEEGHASAEVLDRAGTVRWATGTDDLTGSYQAPSATFELWAFLLRGNSFAGRSATVTEVREWLKHVGGVHLYHRGLRVRPYGDPGHDWLDMNLARSRNPEFRPSTNTSLGRIAVLDENEYLLQKTDRTGFIDSEAFRALRRFGSDSLDWMQSKRIAEREGHREKQKQELPARSTRAAENLRHVVNSLEPAERQAVNKAVDRLESALASEHKMLREELTLYQTLASVGTAVSVFAHEIEGPATDLTASVKAVERRARRALLDQYEPSIGKQIEETRISAEQVARFATLPLGLLKKSKRRRSILDVNKTIGETIDLFNPYLRDAHIDTIRELSEEPGQVHSSVAAVEAIMSNLLTNSVKAFRRQNTKLSDRRLVIRTALTDSYVLISVLDSGPGIGRTLGDRIWLPGITNDENGTGLGLTIVRDTVTELGGKATAVFNGEMGGAEFIIELPRKVS